MFNWVCPQCGRECLPSDNECPRCAEAAAAKASGQAAPVAAAPAPPPPAAHHPYAAQPAATHHWLHGWLAAVLAVVLIGAVGFAVYWFFLPSRRSQASSAASQLETPGTAPAAVAKPHPLGRHIELTGFRVSEDAKKNVQVRFVVVNHSAAEIGDLVLQIALRPSTAAPETEPISSFTAKVATLGPLEAKDVTATAKTALRAYELPDWQFLRAEFQIVSPPAP